MNSEILGIISMFVIALLLGYPLGKYMAKVYLNKPTFLDAVLDPAERLCFRFCGIDPSKEQTWQKQMGIMLCINLIWFILGVFILMTQEWLPLNPDHNPNQAIDQAFNTAVSFLVNCNLQHYSGETDLSYLGQIYLMFLQFVTAATGMAASVTLFYALRQGTHDTLGNYWSFLMKSITRILLPISICIAIVLLINHTPMTFDGKHEMLTLQGDTVSVSTGPVAAFVPIKHLGTNGGGFFGANSSHPLENVNYITNMVEMIAQMLIPFAMVFCLGFFLNKKRLSWMIWSVMTIGFLMLVIPTIIDETKGNPNITAMGVDTSLGNMEGKEIRFGASTSAYWSIATTVISTGSVNSMHDSFMPLSGMNMMLAMMINSFYGGVGVGILNFFIFMILAVFISGLMIGRTPEFLGKKVEACEMKIAMIIALLHPFLILVGTGLSVVRLSTLANKASSYSSHGFSEILYEYTSAAANNGSGFEGLNDNTLWWNISTGFIMLLGRFLPIIGAVAIAGLMANKKYIPESPGTLKTETVTFGFVIFAVIMIITALSFFPALVLGPMAEYFSMLH